METGLQAGEVAKELERLRTLGGNFCDNFVAEFEAFNIAVRDSLARAIIADRAVRKPKSPSP